jgi:hypothetical protein
MKYTNHLRFRKFESLLSVFLVLFLFACSSVTERVRQTEISRIAKMPDMPRPYKMKNWAEVAKNFDQVAFNFNATGDFRPFIWIDNARRNIDQETFGIYTAVGDVRQGPDVHNGEFHESLCTLGALMGAGLTGIDKRNRDGYDFVKMSQNYFNSDNGWNILMNNTCPEVAKLGGGYGRDWWYDIFPNLLYYAVSELYPGVPGADYIQKNIADQFFRADSVLSGNYDYSYFDYKTMKGMRNHIPFQQDAAAGHAYVLYCAHEKFGDPGYLEGAKSAMKALLSQKESRFYEVLLPFGAYTGARLNAEHGTDFDLTKIINWTFDGCQAKDGRTGWGVIVDRWGNYDVSGLQGSITDGGGFGFLMNTFSLAWPLIPMVRYDPHYARAIGKWMLNAANAARLCYPYEIPDNHQWLPEKKAITRDVIAYEGLRKEDVVYKKEALKGISPVALGDGPQWAKSQPEESMFSIYGSSFAGIFGAIIQKTNVKGILKLNCLATDFYRNKAYPTFLFYNPYEEKKQIIYKPQSDDVDLYDVISKKIIAQKVSGDITISLPGNDASLFVEIPSKSKLVHKAGKITANGIVVAYY